MTKGTGLSAEQNERVKSGVLELLKRYDNNQSTLAARLGVHQSTLSGILTGRAGTSYLMATKVARLLGVDATTLLEAVPVPRPDRRAAAAELAREDGVHEAAIQSVLEEAMGPDTEGRSTLWWANRMKMREHELLAGRLPQGRRKKPG